MSFYYESDTYKAEPRDENRSIKSIYSEDWSKKLEDIFSGKKTNLNQEKNFKETGKQTTAIKRELWEVTDLFIS